MNLNEIVEEIFKLPNLLYGFIPKDEDAFMCFLFLKGYRESCGRNRPFSTTSQRDYLNRALDIYSKKSLSNDEKHLLVKLYKRLVNSCNLDIKNMRSKEEVTEYLRILDKDQMRDIVEQIKMYKYIRSIYREYN